MPGRRAPLCLAAALIGVGIGTTAEAAESDRIDFEAVDDPLAASAEFLPVDQAFVFSSRSRLDAPGSEELVAHWDLAQGYYLYRQHFRVVAGEGTTLGELAIPEGERRVDEYFGESEVYFGSVETSIAVLARTADAVTVRFGYQGCAEGGLCYPPVERSATFYFPERFPERFPDRFPDVFPDVQGPTAGFGRWWAGLVLVVLILAGLWSMRTRRDVR